MAEFWGVLEGIKLAKGLGFNHLEINVDALIVVRAIKDGKVGAVECVAILRKILDVLSTFEVVILSHVYQNSNSCVDCLAKHDCLHRKFALYKEIYQFLKDLVELDAKEIIFLSVYLT